MGRNFLNTPLSEDSINFTESSDPFEKQVKRLTAKNRRTLTKIVDSGADFPTIERARKELAIAERTARLKIATEDVDQARKAEKFQKLVISVEGQKRDKANDTIRKLADSGRIDSNTKIQLTFARRTAERSSGIIRESQSRLGSIENKLNNSLARQRQFTVKKGTFSP